MHIVEHFDTHSDDDYYYLKLDFSLDVRDKSLDDLSVIFALPKHFEETGRNEVVHMKSFLSFFAQDKVTAAPIRAPMEGTLLRNRSTRGDGSGRALIKKKSHNFVNKKERKLFVVLTHVNG